MVVVEVETEDILLNELLVLTEEPLDELELLVTIDKLVFELDVIDVVLGMYVAIKQGHADERDEITLVGPQLTK